MYLSMNYTLMTNNSLAEYDLAEYEYDLIHTYINIFMVVIAFKIAYNSMSCCCHTLNV